MVESANNHLKQTKGNDVPPPPRPFRKSEGLVEMQINLRWSSAKFLTPSPHRETVRRYRPNLSNRPGGKASGTEELWSLFFWDNPHIRTGGWELLSCPFFQRNNPRVWWFLLIWGVSFENSRISPWKGTISKGKENNLPSESFFRGNVSFSGTPWIKC